MWIKITVIVVVVLGLSAREFCRGNIYGGSHKHSVVKAEHDAVELDGCMGALVVLQAKFDSCKCRKGN